jgi:hypothetical protein
MRYASIDASRMTKLHLGAELVFEQHGIQISACRWNLRQRQRLRLRQRA